MPEYYVIARVESSVEYRQLEKDLANKKKALGIVEDIRSALWQRKTALESMVTLQRMDYFAHPRTAAQNP